MKKRVKIAILLVLGIGVLIVFAGFSVERFTDTTTNIEDQLGMINLQTYKIDSKCDLSYFVLDLIFTKKQSITSTIMVDEEEQRRWAENEIKIMKDKISKVPPNELDEVLRQKLNREMWDKKYEEFIVKPVMEQNSIHPKLENIVRDWLYVTSGFSPSYGDSYTIAHANYQIVRLTDQDYAEDPECAKKHNEHFSNMMEWLKSEWGY